jgi:hypothetical protein
MLSIRQSINYFKRRFWAGKHLPIRNVPETCFLSFNVLLWYFYANHFKVYSSFCASHTRSQKILNPGKYLYTSLSFYILWSGWHKTGKTHQEKIILSKMINHHKLIYNAQISLVWNFVWNLNWNEIHMNCLLLKVTLNTINLNLNLLTFQQKI